MKNSGCWDGDSTLGLAEIGAPCLTIILTLPLAPIISIQKILEAPRCPQNVSQLPVYCQPHPIRSPVVNSLRGAVEGHNLGCARC